MSFDPSLLSQNLAVYYKRLFPFKLFCKWMSYGKSYSDYFALREFAFIIEGDIYLRYRSFSDPLEFERELRKVNPFKLDIGAVFNRKPKDSKKFADVRPVHREFVIDIDLSDYDTIRSCCSEAKICFKCWRWITIKKFIIVYCKIWKNFRRFLNFLGHFNWKHCLWVFSGRRGIHCWVADESARKLSNAGRSAISEYLTLLNFLSLAVACFKIFVLKHAYPRLDINVSKDMRHLLKSPFCIHPKTGIMSVPISPQQVSNLNIDDLPRIDIFVIFLIFADFFLFVEYKYTSMAPFVQVFEDFVSNLLLDILEC
ncbi:unnamed protein product [Dracunculus medinensis]|uniref:DNA primase n=1 Tax=Dracunculus medinensis TaxID=318479 RepID=A0A0N4U264_DRAME|nr:unnamed protein product [Dracunculus medinensis]